MLEIIVALRVVGTALLAIKLIGLRRNTIVKKCIGKSLIIDKNKKLYVIKEHYIEMFEENAFATIGIINIIISEILNLFYNPNKGNIYVSAIKSIIYSVSLLLLSKAIVYILTKHINKKEDKLIEVDNKLINEGAQAVQIFDE